MAADTHLGTRIKRARERRRWTQQQLADALGVNIKTIDNWENNRTLPRSSIGALEHILGPLPETADVYTDPTERSIWEDTSLPERERRDLIGQLRERRAAHARSQRPPA